MLLSDYQRYRCYEIFPGAIIWLTLGLSIFLAIFFPKIIIYGIIIFDVYWVLRVMYFSFYLLVSWQRFRRAVKTNWFQQLVARFPNWNKKINVIFLPIYNESYEVVCSTLNALKQSSFPARQMYVVLAGEERKKEHFIGVKKQVEHDYAHAFAGLIFSLHPMGLPDEIPGKGSNIHHAEYEFKKYADQKGWNYDDIVVSVFDIDTVVHPEYFAHLNYMYCLHPCPTRSSFQPVTLYNNNIWESPAALRIMAFGTSFWMLFSLARLDSLVTFSSHSMSFRAIMEVGGHAVGIVSEDSRIFFQCWLRYAGNYEVTPLYIPVSMDTVRDTGMWKSFKNLYLQQRRWAWGTENIPYLLSEFRKHPEIAWYKKWNIFFHELEGKWSWAVVAILVTVLGRLPLWFATPEIRQSVLFLNTPEILQNLMRLSLLGLFLLVAMSLFMMPARPKPRRWYSYFYLIAQWVLLPVSLFFFSSLPCLDAVTRLMLGKYLGFNVSAKQRHNT